MWMAAALRATKVPRPRRAQRRWWSDCGATSLWEDGRRAAGVAAHPPSKREPEWLGWAVGQAEQWVGLDQAAGWSRCGTMPMSPQGNAAVSPAADSLAEGLPAVTVVAAAVVAVAGVASALLRTLTAAPVMSGVLRWVQ